LYTKKSELPSTWKNIGESHPSFRFSIGDRIETDINEQEETKGLPKWTPGTIRGFKGTIFYDILLDYPVGNFGLNVVSRDTNNFVRPLGFTKSATHLTDPCGNCGVNEPTDGVVKFLQCGGCRRKRYCTPTCQKADWKKHRVLCQAIIKQNERVTMEIKELIKTGKSEALNDALIDAVYNDDLVIIKKLLKKRGDDINVNAAVYNGCTPLFIAAQNGYNSSVKLLIEAGGNVNQAREDTGASPLFMASQNGHLAIVKVLLKAGGNVNQARTDDGASPLYFAADKGHVAIVEVLLKAGGDIHQVITTGGMSPLYIASQNGNIDIVKILIEAGGDVHQVSNDGYTVLGASSHEGHLEIVRLLLQQPNIDINKGAEGWSPLALAGSHAEIIQLLKDAGAQQINNN